MQQSILSLSGLLLASKMLLSTSFQSRIHYFPRTTSSKTHLASIVSGLPSASGVIAKDSFFVRFKSLSPRVLYLWECGDENRVPQCIGSFNEGTNLIATGQSGDEYFYTASEQVNCDDVLGRFTLEPGSEEYILIDVMRSFLT